MWLNMPECLKFSSAISYIGTQGASAFWLYISV
jgi:hypothetical protein